MRSLHTIHALFYVITTHLLLLPVYASQHCADSYAYIEEGIVGLYLQPSNLSSSEVGLSRFHHIAFQAQVDCDAFLNETLYDDSGTTPVAYLSIHNDGLPPLDVETLDDWFLLALDKQNSLDTIISDFKNKSAIFQFIQSNWTQSVHSDPDLKYNASDHVFAHDMLKWYNIWKLEPNMQHIRKQCNESDNTVDLIFSWPSEYSQFFPILQNYGIAKNQLWDDLPYEIIWDTDISSNATFHIAIFKEDAEWLQCIHTEQRGFTLYDDLPAVSYYENVTDNLIASKLAWSWTYNITLEDYQPLVAYNNCDINNCNSSSCCDHKDSGNKFNFYFWYDDDVWTKSLALYKDLTQYSIEEAICDLFNELYSSGTELALTPNDFALDISFFFNFCIVESGCPNYEDQRREKELFFFPSGIDSDADITGYKMAGTLRCNSLQRAEQIYDMLTNAENTQRFLDYVERRAQEDFGRYNFEVYGVAVGELPQRLLFKVPLYISYGVYSFVAFCCLFAIIASIHGFVIWQADCIRMSGIVYFGLYTWDFYSDIVFDLELLNYDDTMPLFYACTAFIVIPWIANMVSLSRYQQMWCKDNTIRERVYSWFVSWQRLVYVLAAISGSAFGTVELANSYFFGMDFFCMGLNERHLKLFNNHRLWSSIIAENLPQLVIQIVFLSMDAERSQNDIVWLTLISSSLSIGAAALDIYSAKRLFAVIGEPGSNQQNHVTCTMYIYSTEIREKAKKLQITTYALRDAIAETLSIHQRSVEIHFPITTADGFKISFTVFNNASKLTAKDIYERLRRDAISLDATIAPELPRKIKKVWRLERKLPRIPLNDIKVDGVDPADYDDVDFSKMAENRGAFVLNEELNEGAGNIEMVNQQKSDNKKSMSLLNEGGAKAMITAFATSTRGAEEAEDGNDDVHVTDYEAQMAALNAQIAMNQYLMMKQMDYLKQTTTNKTDDEEAAEQEEEEEEEEEVAEEKGTLSQLQQLMMKQMQKMNEMIDMEEAFDYKQFNELSQEWEQHNTAYEPPPLSPLEATKEADEEQEEDDDEEAEEEEQAEEQGAAAAADDDVAASTKPDEP